MPVVAVVTDLERLPLILTLKEIAGIYRISTWTIRRGLQNGTFSPRPWERSPYRWKREDVAADLRRKRDADAPRRARPRPAKASITTGTTRAAR